MYSGTIVVPKYIRGTRVVPLYIRGTRVVPYQLIKKLTFAKNRHNVNIKVVC